ALAGLAFLAIVAGALATLVQARTVRKQRDFAFQQLARAERINQLNKFLLTDAAVGGEPITIDQLLERAEQIVQSENYAGDPVSHVELLISIGMHFADRGEWEKSLRVLQQAYQLSRGLKNPSARAQASCALALPVHRQGEGQYARAESLIQDGLRELPNDSQFALDRVF